MARVIAAFFYLWVGFQPKFLGWPLWVAVQILTIVNWRFGGADATLSLIHFFNMTVLGLTAALLYGTEHWRESDVGELGYHWNMRPLADSTLSKWAWMWYFVAFLGYITLGSTAAILLTWLVGLNSLVVLTSIFALSSIALTLMALEFTGGTKGKLWSSLKQALKTLELVPQPSPA